MPVKLINQNRFFPDRELKALLQLAKRAVRCKGNVLVEVTRGGANERSMAYPCDRLRLGTRWYATDGGMVVLRPHRDKPFDWLRCVERLWETSLHEFWHVREMQERKWDDYDTRLRWRNRPHEMRAVAMAHDAQDRVGNSRAVQDAILNLAVAAEAKEREAK